MYRRFQNRFGTAGVIVAIVALIAALSGTALAASGALTGKQKKEVEKIAKKYAGKPGAPGAAGTNGTNGKDGTPGAAGTNGTNGKDGAAGAAGAAGKSVKAETGPAICPDTSGAVFKVEGAATGTEVCSGEEGAPGAPGAPGPEGSPWTAGGKLPVGSTETGTWAFNATTEDTAVVVPISFPIRLIGELEEENVHFQGETGFATKCTGNAGLPKAASGNLCVYYGAGSLENATLEFFTEPGGVAIGAGVSGTVMHFGVSGSAHGFGSWAVTG